ncbi:MAG: hypothetical protein EOP54_14625 [Sphingobacteriales bacterium]|nr:MAG: hypothetical protein EOP54_14625 [Sphingobacteriales bacterium]
MYQILAYSIYCAVSAFITLYVGWRCYIHGLIFLRYLWEDAAISKAVNRVLLLCYYLVNIGYIVWNISTWKQVDGLPDLINELGFKIGGIMLLLCLLHYINISTLYFFSKKIIHSKNQLL